MFSPWELVFPQLDLRLLRSIHDFAYTLPIQFQYYLSLNEYSTIYFDSLVLKYCQSVAITNHVANFLLFIP